MRSSSFGRDLLKILTLLQTAFQIQESRGLNHLFLVSLKGGAAQEGLDDDLRVNNTFRMVHDSLSPTPPRIEDYFSIIDLNQWFPTHETDQRYHVGPSTTTCHPTILWLIKTITIWVSLDAF
jgi:hypothetical protein